MTGQSPIRICMQTTLAAYINQVRLPTSDKVYSNTLSTFTSTCRGCSDATAAPANMGDKKGKVHSIPLLEAEGRARPSASQSATAPLPGKLSQLFLAQAERPESRPQSRPSAPAQGQQPRRSSSQPHPRLSAPTLEQQSQHTPSQPQRRPSVPVKEQRTWPPSLRPERQFPNRSSRPQAEASTSSSTRSQQQPGQHSVPMSPDCSSLCDLCTRYTAVTSIQAVRIPSALPVKHEDTY